MAEGSANKITKELQFQGNQNHFIHVTLPETNSPSLKIAGWETTFLLGFGLFSGALAVSFREIKNCLSILAIHRDDKSTNL